MAYTDECKEKIDAARDAYDALSADGKAMITDETYKVLTDAEAKYAELKAAADKEEADKAAAKNAQDKIDAIGEVVYSDECKTKIEEARAAYDALTNEQKALVTNYGTLIEAEYDYAELEQQAHPTDVEIVEGQKSTFRRCCATARSISSSATGCMMLREN
ncbi:MAG: hypothetical protein IJQ20_02035 [Paludibacteraceae bacterium]|nr:hypothetical protein [Paludibacteraceae bacterium]